MKNKYQLLSIIAFLILINPQPGISQEQNNEAEKLHKIFDDEWEWGLKEYPFSATYVGDPRYADQVPDLSFDAIKRQQQHARDLLWRLEQIKTNALDLQDKLNYELFHLNVSRSVEGQQFPSELIPISQMGGIHSSLNRLAKMSPKYSVKNIEDIVTRISQLPLLIDQTIELMQEGVKQGITPAKITLAEVSNQIQAQITDNPEDSPLFTAIFSGLSNEISEPDRNRLKKRATEIISTKVYPAFKKLDDYWQNEYYPNTRESIGLSSLPNGMQWYNFNIKTRTTTNLNADQIHELGLSEVGRIRDEMKRVMLETGFDGSLQDFFQFLRTDEQFFYTRESDLLSGYREIAKLIDPELPKIFGKLPRLPFGIIAVPDYDAKSQTTAYYNPGSLEAGRAGYFYANTYALDTRPKWEMVALTLHEAMPGHHLQLALQQELDDVPKFRRYGGYTAFVEGWGLYAESLGEDMGMYTDPYDKFGQLTYEMWRAVRLVVDTGMHAKGWTRKQAIDFFMDNAGKSEHDISVEIDRYIVWPGQALAYKIGELKFKELRAFASKELGDEFNIRTFHDQVLGSGALPLSILEQNVKDWVSNYTKN